MSCTHPPEVSCHRCDGVSCHRCDGWAEVEKLRAEVERLTVALVHTEADLTQARLDLISSDAIRSMLVQQSCDVAKDIARALNTIEGAFHAGFVANTGMISPDQAFRRWSESIKKQ